MAFGEFGASAFGRVFTEGFDFSPRLADHNPAELALLIGDAALAFCLVDMFNTTGTLYGACARGDLLTPEGNVPNMERAMLAADGGHRLRRGVRHLHRQLLCGGVRRHHRGRQDRAGHHDHRRTVPCGHVFQSGGLPVPNCATAAFLIYGGILMMDCTKKIN